MKKSARGLRNGGLLLLLLLVLLPGSLSADDFHDELMLILQDFDSTLLSLERSWQKQGENLITLNSSMDSLRERQNSLEQTLSKQSEQYDYLSSTMLTQETTLKDLEQSATDLQNSLIATQRALRRTQALNRVLLGGFAVTLGISLFAILF